MTAPATAPAAPVVVADRFPATVHSPGGAVYRSARVVLTRPNGDHPAELWAWTDQRPHPELALHLTWTPGSSALPAGRSPWTVTTPDGPVLVERGQGCGCSSPLRRWRPWEPWQLGALREGDR